jgi:hypothetical protein
MTQPAHAHPAPTPSAQPHPAHGTLRRLLATLASLAAVILACGSVVLAWFDAAILDEDSFTASADTVAASDQFRQELTDAAVQDIMASDEVSRYLGDGSGGDSWYSGLQDLARGGAEKALHGAVSSAVDSGDFESVWNETAVETHRENLGEDPSQTLVLDATPLYRAVDERVGGIVGLDLGLGDQRHLVELEEAGPSGQGETAAILHRIERLATAVPAFAVGAVVLTLAAAALLPRHRALAPAGILAASGILTWAVMSLGSGALVRWAEGLDGTGGVVLGRFMEAVTEGVPGWALTSLGIGLGGAVLLIIADVLIGSRRGPAEVF